MIKVTNIPALVKVKSHKSGGRAEIVFSHDALTDEEIFTAGGNLVNKEFRAYAVGSFVQIRVDLSGKRRYVTVERQVAAPGSIESVVVANWVHTQYDALRNAAQEYADEAFWKEGSLEREMEKLEAFQLLSTVEPEGGEKVPQTPKPPTTPETTEEGGIYVSPEDARLFDTVRKMSENGVKSNVLMIGASGFGKTTLPRYFAEKWGMDFLQVSCGTITTPTSIFGSKAAQNGSTVDDDGKSLFILSEFAQAVTKGNCVVLLDELNRTPMTYLGPLFNLLDDTGSVYVADHEIKRGENVIFVATANMGNRYTGTFDLDIALTNRFGVKVEVKALPINAEIGVLKSRTGISEEDAIKVVTIMDKLRGFEEYELNADVSTRPSLQIAQLAAFGMRIEDAVNSVIIAGLTPEERRLVIDTVRTVL